MGETSALDLNQFVIKEHVGLLKLTDVYDIFDAKTQQKIALARENISGFLKVLRLLVNKQMLPTKVTVTDRKSTRLNSSHIQKSRMPSSA